MKFIDFIKKYYEVSQRNFSTNYTYKEQQILKKNIFQRRTNESVSLLSSQRKQAIINSYIFIVISIVLLLVFTLININLIWGFIPLLIIIYFRLIYVD